MSVDLKAYRTKMKGIALGLPAAEGEMLMKVATLVDLAKRLESYTQHRLSCKSRMPRKSNFQRNDCDCGLEGLREAARVLGPEGYASPKTKGFE